MHLSHLMHVLEKRIVTKFTANPTKLLDSNTSAVLFNPYFSIENNETFVLEDPVKFLNKFWLHQTPHNWIFSESC